MNSSRLPDPSNAQSSSHEPPSNRAPPQKHPTHSENHHQSIIRLIDLLDQRKYPQTLSVIRHDIVIFLYKVFMKTSLDRLKIEKKNYDEFCQFLTEKLTRCFERYPFLMEEINHLKRLLPQTELSALNDTSKAQIFPDPLEQPLFISKASLVTIKHQREFEELRKYLPKSIEKLSERPRHEMYSEGVSVVYRGDMESVVKCNTTVEYTKGIQKDSALMLNRLDELAQKRKREGEKELHWRLCLPDAKRDPIDSYFQPVPEQNVVFKHMFAKMYLNKKKMRKEKTPIDVVCLNQVQTKSTITKVEVGPFFSVVAFGHFSGKIVLLVLDPSKSSSSLSSFTADLNEKYTVVSNPVPETPKPNSTSFEDETANKTEQNGNIESLANNDENNADVNASQANIGAVWTDSDDFFDLLFEKHEAEVKANSINNEKSDSLSQHKKIKLIGHEGMITCLSFSYDERYLVSGSVDKTLRLWGVNTGCAIAAYQVHLKTVWDVQMAQKGPYFISGGDDCLAIFWNTSNKNPICAMNHMDSVSKVCLTNNLKYGVSYSRDRTVFVWELKKTSTPARIIFTDFSVSAMTLNMNGDMLYLGYENGHCQAWDIARVKKMRTIRSQYIWKENLFPVVNLSLSSDETMLLVVTPINFGFYNTSDLEVIPSYDVFESSITEEQDYIRRNHIQPNRFYQFYSEDIQKNFNDYPKVLTGMFHVMNFAVIVTNSIKWRQPSPEKRGGIFV